VKTDEELMAAYVAGDEAAFRELFERYAPGLLGLFRRHVPGPEDAQDLLQQTFLQLHRARLDFRQGSLVRPWVLTIALNLQRELFRRRGRKPTTALAIDPAAAPQASSAEQREDAVRVRAALAELPGPQREVIELHWFQGLPFAAVARIVGASVGAVKVRAHRGYERLRALLGGDAAGGKETDARA
jgi:RNA polymerase sigma factor (sigma-70 family)